MMATGFCPNCGTPRGEGNFCANCGASLVAGQAPAATPATGASAEAAPEEREVWRGAPDAVLAPIAAKTTSYRLTTERLVVDKGLLGKRNDSLELFRVKDVQVRKSLTQRARGVGDVIVASTDASTPVVSLEAVKDPDGVAAQIRSLVQEARRRGNVYMREGL